MTHKSEKPNKLFRRACFTVLILACVFAAATAARAWLSYERRAAAIAEIDAPMSLWIRAGNNEDAMYIDMSNINVAGGQKYKDFIFAIAGEYVSSFKIQLAYTTNNQFSYELYKAEEVESTDPYDVEYYSKLTDGYRYYSATGSEISMTVLNGQDGSDRLAIGSTSDYYYSETYGSYTNVHKNARPIYCQTGSAITVESTPFTEYFILRVKWDERENDRETDMIYISATVE